MLAVFVCSRALFVVNIVVDQLEARAGGDGQKKTGRAVDPPRRAFWEVARVLASFYQGYWFLGGAPEMHDWPSWVSALRSV